MADIGKCVKILCDELKKDQEYFYAWQSNIAMIFFDELRSGKILTEQDTLWLHERCNIAAKRFLNQLIKDGVR